MAVQVKFRIPSATDGARFRSVTDVTLDYESASELPNLIRFNRRLWERTGGANSVNYRPKTNDAIVDLDDVDQRKIIDA